MTLEGLLRYSLRIIMLGRHLLEINLIQQLLK